MKNRHRNPQRTSMKALLLPWICLSVMAATNGRGAGTLLPTDGTSAPAEIREHHVEVVINNGFARTKVTQRFHNPNPNPMEARYRFPMPDQAALSEVTIARGDDVLEGEVLPKEAAETVYREERDAGNTAGLASRQGYREIEFAVSAIGAGEDVTVRFVYYQALQIDTGIGRYLYPLEEGGTDEPQADTFWDRNRRVSEAISVSVELKSAWPVADIRMPGLQNVDTEHLAEGHWRARWVSQGGVLARDFAFYYRLQDGLPGRIEVIPYRAAPDRPGTFMMVVTPGLDLRPLSDGADYCFVLDTSGSMASKIATLVEGVVRVLGDLRPGDRFRIITFSGDARELAPWQQADEANVRAAIAALRRVQATGGTNLHAAIARALCDIDDDRATSLVLVTDGCTNTGIVAPKRFHALLKQYDVRVFGFLMGNNANWPLMKTITEASGGFFKPVSNSDDIVGQLVLAKSKVTRECLHDATLSIRGVRTFDTSDGFVGKVYHGQQLVFFGRYTEGGEATVSLRAKRTGEDRVYRTTISFPTIDTDHPELERLWALDVIDDIEQQRDLGLTPEEEAAQAVRDLGVQYQLVTDETSMVVLNDETFAARGIERRNRERVAREHQARARRAAAPIRNHRVDRDRPAFNLPAPSIGGGSIDPFSICLIAGLGAAACCNRRRGDESGQPE